MKDYLRDDIQICLDFDEENKLLEEHFGESGGTFSPHYEARIVYNHRKPQYIDLIIYYPSSEYLFEKFQFLQEKGVNIFGGIKTRPPQQTWDFPEILDFSCSKLINIEESHHWEHNKKPLALIIDNLDLLIHDRYIGDGVFQLTENVFEHLNEYIDYGQLGNYDPSDNFIFSNKNREITFGKTQFVLSFKHDYGNATKFNFEINRDAYFTITDNSKLLTEKEIFDLGNLLCILMSVYWQKTIDYFFATVRVNNVQNYLTHKKIKYSSHTVAESLEYDLESRYPTVYDFLESLDYAKLLPCESLLNDIVPRIIKAKSVDEISEFMLLYNVIEQIRNYCISNPVNGNNLEIREEFKFTRGKTTTNKFIKNKIKEIVDIVDETDRDGFLLKASDKVSFIKKTGLIDQFDSLVTYLALRTETYNLDFKNLVKIRNDIYHGKAPHENIKPFNVKMSMLINDLVLSLIQE